MRKIIALGIMLLFLGMTISSSTGFNLEQQSTTATHDGNTLYVGGNGPNNYTKIQDAINDSNNGDTVYVYDDSSPYYENILVDKSINLIGEDRDTTIIDGYNNGVVIKINDCSYVNIYGFTIIDGGYKYFEDILILIESCDVCIISNNYLDNTETSEGIYPTTGVYLIESNNIQITNNIIYDGMGFALRKSNDNTIAHNELLHVQNVLGDSSNNNISYNDFSYGWGIEFYNSNYNIFSFNNMNNIESTGFYLERSSHCDIYMNNIKSCKGFGIHFDRSSNNIFHFNNIILLRI